MRFIRFSDLVERGIIESWEGLRRLKELFGFPTGRLIGARRVWTPDEVEEWLASRPTDPYVRRARGAKANADALADVSVQQTVA